MHNFNYVPKTFFLLFFVRFGRSTAGSAGSPTAKSRSYSVSLYTGKNIAILDEIWESELGDWELFPSLSSQFRKKLYRSIPIPECLGKKTNLIACKWQYCSLRTETLPGPGSRYCFPKNIFLFSRVSFLFFILHIRPSSYGKLYMAEAAAAVCRVKISKCHKAISRLFSPLPPYLEKRKKRKKRILFQLRASLDFFHGQPTTIFPYKPAHFFAAINL